MTEGFDRVPKVALEAVVQSVFDVIENGDEEIFPDSLSQTLADDWRNGSGKGLEHRFATLYAQFARQGSRSGRPGRDPTPSRARSRRTGRVGPGRAVDTGCGRERTLDDRGDPTGFRAETKAGRVVGQGDVSAIRSGSATGRRRTGSG
ncbi:hypothetical protein [Saccharothrix yanglingensis]|uniref:hypothetical protein n=1 Tax=Saccharothrix yanglingensis TaxID=659496 RepID=UPI0027D30C12|nr:hypothetical protein [Saccharothrix yanglingensis]